MSRASITYNQEELQLIESALGTRGLAATVRAAFRRVLDDQAERQRTEAQRRLIDRLKTMRGLDLDKPEVMEEAWR